MKKVALLLLAIAPLVMGGVARPASRSEESILDGVRSQVVAHAPYKQWDLVSGRPNRSIGRTPGAACEAISFLVRDVAATANATSRAKAVELANWVVQLQSTASAMPVPGGVPATPDLPGAQATYYYAIDAGFCGAAMLDMADMTGDDRYASSARAFGGFVLSMMRDGTGQPLAAGSPGRAPCEAVVQTAGGKPAWNCRRYVKSLALLPFLSRLDRRLPRLGYGEAARDTRSALMPGLKGLWEYADGTSATPRWHRIEGPQGQPDMFVFGDTVSYALRGLHEYEGVSPDVRSVYADVSRPRSRDERTAAYDPRGAYAGYIVASTRAADPFSRYYDIVTLGHLRALRADLSPADLKVADGVLVQHVAQPTRIGWKMDMAHRVSQTGMGDISTLSSVGTALVDIRRPN